jgi:hypothetical protein
MPQEERSHASEESDRRPRGEVRQLHPSVDRVRDALGHVSDELADLRRERDRFEEKLDSTRDELSATTNQLSNELSETKIALAVEKTKNEIGQAQDARLRDRIKELEAAAAEHSKVERDDDRRLADFQLTVGLLATVPVGMGTPLLLVPAPQEAPFLPYVALLMIVFGVALGVLAILSGKPKVPESTAHTTRRRVPRGRKNSGPEEKPN